MSNPLIDIANAVYAELSKVSLSQYFNAERVYKDELELEVAKDLRVTVMPGSVVSTVNSRSTTRQEFQIDVAVRKKLETETIEEVDGLMTLIDEIDKFMQFRKLEDYPAATWTASKTKYPWVPEHLRSLRQYTGLLVLTYRIG